MSISDVHLGKYRYYKKKCVYHCTLWYSADEFMFTFN